MAQASTRTREPEGQAQDQNKEQHRERDERGTAVRPHAGTRTQPDEWTERRRQRAASRRAGYHFDPEAAARAGLIRLAATAHEDESTYQAIRMYTHVLERYPDTAAADAAAEGLVDLAHTMESQGKYYTALNILDKLYRLL